MNRRFVALSVVSLACSRTPPEPIAMDPVKPTSATGVPTASSASASAAEAKGNGAQEAPIAVPSVTPIQKGGEDPLKGAFTLKEATKGLAETGTLLATLETTKGKIECKLLSDKAPTTVANFVGLARGVRPWKDPSGNWVKKPAYDGTGFHRVIKGFMIQGGDPRGNGSGEPGYVIPDEIWSGAKHDRAGLLCMANRGPNTNGAQFFITDDAAPHLDSGYTIFGECEPVSAVHDIANVEVDGSRPVSPVTIKSVKISRVADAKAGKK